MQCYTCSMPQWLKGLVAISLVALTAYGANRVLGIYGDLSTEQPVEGVLSESIRAKTKVPTCESTQVVVTYNKRLAGCVPASWGEHTSTEVVGQAGSYHFLWARKGVSAAGSTLALNEAVGEDLSVAELMRTVSSLTQCKAMVGTCATQSGTDGFTLLSGSFEFQNGRPAETFVLVLPDALSRDDPRNLVFSSPIQGENELLAAAKTVILR